MAAALHTDWLKVRCTPADKALAEAGAQGAGLSVSQWVRSAFRTAAELQGIDPAAIPSRDAGSLYNVVSGQRCYALVAGGRIEDMSYHASEPALSDFAPGRGDRVLPVEHVDSEPFDISAHWRLPPIDTVEADRVVRTFPVVPKSLEAL